MTAHHRRNDTYSVINKDPWKVEGGVGNRDAIVRRLHRYSESHFPARLRPAASSPSLV